MLGRIPVHVNNPGPNIKVFFLFNLNILGPSNREKKENILAPIHIGVGPSKVIQEAPTLYYREWGLVEYIRFWVSLNADPNTLHPKRGSEYSTFLSAVQG